MKVFVTLLFASFFLLLLALALSTLGVVGLALRWAFQVWTGGGAHRPYDQSTMGVVRPSAWRPREDDSRDGMDSHEII
jgi:hypothetical protein